MTAISAPMMPLEVKGGAEPPARRQLVSSATLGMLIFIAVELMFFAGLISAFTIVKSTAPPGAWPPPGQPRLPLELTGITTLVLLCSGALAWLSWRAFSRRAATARVTRPLVAALVLGASFVVVQGVEWLRLVGEGLTMRASTYGSFFYMIVGAHALHALAGLAALAWCWRRHAAGRLAPSSFAAVLALWTFVVALWPALYAVVYL
ncbi:MAG: cytochrome c oxidase subunit 3 [Deltaproteobacteria bacterium]|nr:cytochrome c oxidase subunit 3 [Deltaproteobacteria bacterium]